ncbi:O-linked N-acetylglucosamine transferase, SPINDLY family protein [Luteibacter jiangsuensis]
MDAGALTETETDKLNRLGRGLFDAGRYVEARTRFELAARHPAARGAALNVAQCDIQLSRFDDAVSAANRLLDNDPSFVPAWEVLAEGLAAVGRETDAMEALKHALALAPGAGKLWRRLGHLQQRVLAYEPARESYQNAVKLDASDTTSLAALVALKRALCDWSDLGQLSERLRASVRARHGAVQPLAFLGEGVGAEEQRLCAEAWIGKRVKQNPARVIRERSGGRPRIGFVSYGFGAHPTAILASAVIEAMCSTGADLHLFCTGPNDGTAYRDRLEAAAPIHDVAGLDVPGFADKVRSLGVDVLVDLDGYSRERLPSVFALRPALLQLAWLGFPGTTGADFFDYVVADRFVLPQALCKHFTEPVAWLPRCYQPNDPTRIVPEPLPRKAYGLPEGGMVFVCFNAAQKLNPSSFLRMLEVLKAVPDSVLWLLEGPGNGKQRLCDAAAVAGVGVHRLVFMPRRGHADYLAAYRHADLFLDTEHYNAHTTASDAMWAGCPILTRPGDTFASRVAGSLNHHAGLAELNAADDAEFIATAVRFATDESFRSTVTSRLRWARSHSSLFDPSGFASDFLALVDRLLAERSTPGNQP